MSQRARALGLYRGILRAHRDLPREMKNLGNAYVREEFRRHRAAQARFLVPFFVEWERYLADLRARPPVAGAAAVAGADLPADAAASLSDEQRIMLESLRKEATAVGAAALGGGVPIEGSENKSGSR